jgi:hypothetical protein
MDTYTIKLFEAEEINMPGGNLTEDLTLPVNAENGDLALLINQNPLKSYLRQNNEWIEKQFVKIGEATKSDGVILDADVISYAFNGETTLYLSACTNNQTYVLNHNVGSKVLPPSGYYNNISGASYLTNGSSGYPIVPNETSYGSTFGLVGNKSLSLYTEANGIWEINTKKFTVADAEIFVKRSF